MRKGWQKRLRESALRSLLKAIFKQPRRESLPPHSTAQCVTERRCGIQR
eukprot:CAMPEP_0203840472 /NCGR_PEP_ID=MMETSP0359-20131031/799_1 /ASSEMBLY_ACC=CAM_ASM_000338 /TAXON_ID=268821 /ORGANISM="Scrippsiella Hangoei, Strain SHTV-5" /LENGTH=48 /DNA_ID= /DNA_START= /DNA_END= /DNA_ORIENTATION=